MDVLLARQLRSLHPGLPLSRRWLRRLFEARQVYVDGKPCGGANVPGSGSHELRIERWDPERLAREFEAVASPRGAFVPVAYEDGALLVLDKQAGVPSMPHSGAETDSAVNAALAHFPALRGVGNSPLEPGLLHRLDTATRGLLLFAKTNTEYLRLKSLWKSGDVLRLYRAEVEQAPAQTLIDFPIGHGGRAAKKVIAVRRPEDLKRLRAKPQPARTEILETEQLESSRYALLIRLHTGVMHQIRCHLAAIGSPIIGDTLYGGAPAEMLQLAACRMEIPRADGSRTIVTLPG